MFNIINHIKIQIDVKDKTTNTLTKLPKKGRKKQRKKDEEDKVKS